MFWYTWVAMVPHPGTILYSDFLKPQQISPYRLAQEIEVSKPRICDIIRGKRAISPNTAIRLSRYFGNEPGFWLNLQQKFDLEVELKKFPITRNSQRRQSQS